MVTSNVINGLIDNSKNNGNISSTTKNDKSNSSLDVNDFLQLLVAQMQYQDPIEEKLKEQKKVAKANAKASELKEIQLRPVTGEADFKRKVSDADEFLAEGHRVKVSVQFKGREQAHMQENIAKITSDINALIVSGMLEGTPSYNGNRINLMYIPKKK